MANTGELAGGAGGSGTAGGSGAGGATAGGLVAGGAAVGGAAATASAALHSSFTIDPFDRHRMKWSRWIERLEGAFVLFGVREEAKLFMLLHYMGGDTYDVLCDKLAPEKPQRKTYDDIVAALETHFNPEPLEILENFRFKCRKQGDDRPEESVDEYLIALRKLAITCNFGEYLNTALRNQFVFGMKDRVIQSRLLEVRNLTLERAREIAVSMELSSKGGREIQSMQYDALQGKPEVNLVDPSGRSAAKTKVTNTSANKKNKEKLGSGTKGECFRCGSALHFANKCPHIRAECHYCKKIGHLKSVCLQAKKDAGSESETHLLEESTGESDHCWMLSDIVTIDEICKLESCEPSTSGFFVEVRVNDADICFEMDTGAPVTIISTEDKEKFFPTEKLLPSDTELVSYCNSRINIEGMLKVTAECRAKTFELPLYVSNIQTHPLLGRQWITEMRIDLNEVAFTDVHTLDSTATALPNSTPASVESLVENIQFHRTDQHANADAFAKLPLKVKSLDTVIEGTDFSETLLSTVEELTKATASDLTVKVLVQDLRNGKLVEPVGLFGVDQAKFTLQEGCEVQRYVMTNEVCHGVGAPCYFATDEVAYRKTVYPAMEKSHSVMLFNRQIRSRLDLLLPETGDATKPVEGKVRDLPEGVRVTARDYFDKFKWKCEAISEKLRMLHHYVQLDDGRTWKCHIDQLREVGSNLPCEGYVPATVFPDETEEPVKPVVSAQASAEPAPGTDQSPPLHPIPAMPSAPIKIEETRITAFDPGSNAATAGSSAAVQTIAVSFGQDNPSAKETK